MTSQTPCSVVAEQTPNPASLRFTVNRPIAQGGPYEYTSAAETFNSPLAKKLFIFPWVAGVLIGPDFVTVTKHPGMEWEMLREPVADFIRNHVVSGEATVYTQATGEAPAVDDGSPVARRIREIIDTEVRPAVARDGGDIVFESFQDGIVRSYLRGSCSGCPSSLMTLKMGIEQRLKAEVPEVEEVVAI